MKSTNWILVPTDYSLESRRALEAADKQAKQQDAGLIILHVEKPTEHVRTKLSFDEGALRKWTGAIQHTPSDRVAYITCHGNPAEMILRIAAQYRPRKIIMGHGGDTMRPGVVAASVGAGFQGIVEVVSAHRDDILIHTRVA